MFVDSGPGLAVILAGSLLALLLIGTVVVVSYRRCRHRVKSGEDRNIGSTERAAAETQNEHISPVRIYYGETSFQPGQLKRGHDQSPLAPGEVSIGRASRNFSADGPAVSATAEESSPATVAAAYAVNIPASTHTDSVRHNSVAAVTRAAGNIKLRTQSKQVEAVADKSRRSTAEVTKSLVSTAAADRLSPRRSLAVATISEELGEPSTSVAHTIRGLRDGGRGGDRRHSDGHVRSPGDTRENTALRFIATATTTEKYVESQRRSSALFFPTAVDPANPGVQRPLPLPPTNLTGSRLETSDISSGYGDEVSSALSFAADAHQSRRESSKSEMSLPVASVHRLQAGNGRYLPRTSWSGPALPMPSFQTN